MSVTNETPQHKVERFRTYENFVCHIPEENIVELGYIIHNLLKDSKTVDTLSFIENVEQHIDDVHGHHIDLSDVAYDLIYQLYGTYRDAGYTGSVKDMLIAIEKDVEVASHIEMIEGWTETKAVNVIEWRWRLARHQQDNNAHKALIDSFRPQHVLNLTPIVSYHYKYSSQDLITITDVPIPYWEGTDGTINLEFCMSIYQDCDKDILTVTMLDGSVFHVHLHVAEARSATITFYFDDEDPVATITYRAPFVPQFVDRISISYNKNRIAIRDVLKKFLVPILDRTIILSTISSELKLGQNNNSLRSVAVYRKGISVSEQNFFLN